MNGCPLNKTTGRPIIYGHEACPIRQRIFIRWVQGVSPPKPIFKRICDKCGAEFEQEAERVQIPLKAG